MSPYDRPILTRAAAVGIILVLSLGAVRGCSKAIAHDIYTGWKDPETGVSCCDTQDCSPFPDERVMIMGNGYMIFVPGRLPELIPFSRAIVSPDGRYHRCERLWDARDGSAKIGDTRCFAAPGMGS